MPQQQTHRWDVPFGGSNECTPWAVAVRLVFPFIFNQVGCLFLQASKPYQGINFPYQHFCRHHKIITESAYAAERVGRL